MSTGEFLQCDMRLQIEEKKFFNSCFFVLKMRHDNFKQFSEFKKILKYNASETKYIQIIFFWRQIALKMLTTE